MPRSPSVADLQMPDERKAEIRGLARPRAPATGRHRDDVEPERGRAFSARPVCPFFVVIRMTPHRHLRRRPTPGCRRPTTPGATAGASTTCRPPGFDRHDLRSGSRPLRPADRHRDDPGHPQHAPTQPHRGGHRTDPVPTRRHRRVRRRPAQPSSGSRPASATRPARPATAGRPLTGCPGWRAGCGCCREREREACHQPGGQCLTGNTGVLGLRGPTAEAASVAAARVRWSPNHAVTPPTPASRSAAAVPNPVSKTSGPRLPGSSTTPSRAGRWPTTDHAAG